MNASAHAAAAGRTPKGIWKVIGASSAGTMIEWYDFYIFGALAPVIAPLFYPSGNDTLALIAYLSTFAVGFVVRPFGALFFGRIGDRVGRKVAFLITLLIMGGATALIGVLPTYETIGIAAPLALLAIRVLQGLALGGEYGGAAVYVAEHAPDHRRGFYTSFIQITATLGLFVSLAVILSVQGSMSAEAFSAWGWRLPFLLSLLLVGVSFYMRVQMRESPIFEQLRERGMTSAAPIREAFTQPANLKRALVSLFGATAGQGVVWYTGQFYALFYLQSILNVGGLAANTIVACALLLGMPFFVLCGALSDRIGRKRLMMAGFALAVVSYLPIYGAMRDVAGSQVTTVQSQAHPVTGDTTLTPLTLVDGQLQPASKVLTDLSVGEVLRHPAAHKLIGLVWLQVLLVTLVYGPIAAYLVEAFPARIRYTAMSLPYHLGNGVFGGLLPVIGLTLVARTGDIHAGLYYPMAIAAMSLVVGSLLLPQTHGTRLWDETVEPVPKPTAE
ncbi:MFS transporter [Immundisolibacter sp.]|uniref:MFS transporter n=1 Tax=Immundisolibacter sp. TaxID=1934948 RepID=UPI003F82BDCF